MSPAFVLRLDFRKCVKENFWRGGKMTSFFEFVVLDSFAKVILYNAAMSRRR